MAISERVGTGLFIGVAIVWYLIFSQPPDCTYIDTGEEVPGCKEMFQPLLNYFCALPPLVLAVLVHTLSKGDEYQPSLMQIPVDEQGRTVISEQTNPASSEEKLAFSFRAGMTFGGFAFAGAYAFIFVVGLLAVPMLVLCGMMGSSCTDDDFAWAENAINFGRTMMWIGFWVFMVSAVGTAVLRKMSDEGRWSPLTSERQQTKKVVVPCPSCEKKLKFPADYAGKVRCPNCDHVFVISND